MTKIHQIQLKLDLESETLTDQNGKPVKVTEVEIIDDEGEITFTKPELN